MLIYIIKSKKIKYCILILGNPPLSNPYGDPNLSQPIMALQQNVADILFVRTSYVKKIIEDCSNSEETIKLLRFCCWENPQFSSTVLSELLWQVKAKKRISYGNGFVILLLIYVQFDSYPYKIFASHISKYISKQNDSSILKQVINSRIEVCEPAHRNWVFLCLLSH